MAPFRDGNWSQRFSQLGDAAEGVFEATYPEGFLRFGLNRPPINLANVPDFIRYAPDYLTGKGLVEVQGFGRDQTLKLKVLKRGALRVWHEFFRVDFFVWDSHHKRYGWIRFPDLEEVITDGDSDIRQFHDGPWYHAISADHLPIIPQWTQFGDDLGVAR